MIHQLEELRLYQEQISDPIGGNGFQGVDCLVAISEHDRAATTEGDVNKHLRQIGEGPIDELASIFGARNGHQFGVTGKASPAPFRHAGTAAGRDDHGKVLRPAAFNATLTSANLKEAEALANHLLSPEVEAALAPPKFQLATSDRTIRIGLSDAAAMFVFVSGYAGGLAFGGVYKRAGWLLGTARIGLRIWQLYIAQLAIVLVVAAVWTLTRYLMQPLVVLTNHLATYTATDARLAALSGAVRPPAITSVAD